MAGAGFFLGGAASGFMQAQEQFASQDFRQQELKLQAQGQQNAQQRFEMARLDQVRADAMKGIDDAITQLKIAGVDNTKIAQQMAPWMEAVRKLSKSSGIDPATVDAQFATSLAKPPATQTEAAMQAAKEKPEVKVLTTPSGEQEIRIINPRAGTVSAPPGSSTTDNLPMASQPGVPGTAAPPVAMTTGGFNQRFADTFAGRSLDRKGAETYGQTASLPPGAPGAVQSDLPSNPSTSTTEGGNLLDQLAKHSGMTADQIDMTARQLNDGNVSVLTNLGRGRQGGAAVKAIRAWAAHILMVEQGMTADEAANAANMNAAQFQAIKRGASALGQREAQVVGAITTAQNTAPRVLEASANVDRTQYPSLNSVLLAWRQGTGDENVVRLGIAINTFVNNYARALGAGSAQLTDTARREAMANLERAWSKGQISAAIDQMLNKELPSELAGAKGGLEQFLGKKGSAKPAEPTKGEWKIERID